MTPTPKRWFHWSLRTMFVVVTVLCVLLSWIVWNVNQVRERERLLGLAGVLKVHRYSNPPARRGYTRDIPGDPVPGQIPSRPAAPPSPPDLPKGSPPMSKRVPVAWSLFGAKHTDYLMLDRYTWSQSDLQHVREMFPEATIYYEYVGNVQLGKDGRASGMEIHVIPRWQWPASLAEE